MQEGRSQPNHQHGLPGSSAGRRRPIGDRRVSWWERLRHDGPQLPLVGQARVAVDCNVDEK